MLDNVLRAELALLCGLTLAAGCGSGGTTSVGPADGGSGSSGANVGGRSGSGSGGGGASAGGEAGMGGVSGGNSGSSGSSAGGAGGSEPTLFGGPCTEPLTSPSPPPCASGQPKQNYCNRADTSEVIMAVCPGYIDSQCDAGEACGPGWHLCTGTDYLARGGRDIPQPDGIVSAWIAACVRDPTGTRLRDGVCSECSERDIAGAWAMIYGCTGVSLSPGMEGPAVGVVTDRSCHRLQDNVPATAGYWSLDWAYGISAHAVCCVDG
jgi:hypothetical protein